MGDAPTPADSCTNAAIWDELFPRERGRLLELLIEEVRFHAVREDVEITFRTNAPEALRAGQAGDAA